MEKNQNETAIDLTTLFLSISSAAFLNLGGQVDAAGVDNSTRKPKLNLEVARQNIQLLELLQEKTKGNRSAEEDSLLEHLLFELRMKYVGAQKASKT